MLDLEWLTKKKQYMFMLFMDKTGGTKFHTTSVSAGLVRYKILIVIGKTYFFPWEFVPVQSY